MAPRALNFGDGFSKSHNPFRLCHRGPSPLARPLGQADRSLPYLQDLFQVLQLDLQLAPLSHSQIALSGHYCERVAKPSILRFHLQVGRTRGCCSRGTWAVPRARVPREQLVLPL